MKRLGRRATVAAAALAVAITAAPAEAAGPSGTQSTTVTVAAPAYLTLTMPGTIAAFGTATAGSSATASSGSLTIGDTNTANPWTLDVAGTDMTAGGNYIPFTALSVVTGATHNCVGLAAATPACLNLPGSSFSGTDSPTPGQAFSTPIGVATENCGSGVGGPTPQPCVSGSWQVNTDYGLAVPTNQANAAYTGTLQYTLIG